MLRGKKSPQYKGFMLSYGKTQIHNLVVIKTETPFLRLHPNSIYVYIILYLCVLTQPTLAFQMLVTEIAQRLATQAILLQSECTLT